MRFGVIASFVMVLALRATLASAQAIDVYFNSNGSDCDATVPLNTPVTWYIMARLGGAAALGITGAEFRQDGTPVGWFMTPTASPAAALAIGNPITGGCDIAFAACQPGITGLVLLYTVSGFATSTVSETYLSIRQHSTPSPPSFQCPFLTLCDPPVFTKICVPGGQAIMNGRSCTVAVEPASWSKVKSMYH